MLYAVLLLIASLAMAALTLADRRGGPSRPMRRRIERVRLGAVPEPAARDPSQPVTVRRETGGALFGSLGQGLAGMVPRAAVLQQRLDQAGLKLGAFDYAVVSTLVGAVLALSLQVLLSPPGLALLGIGITAALAVPHAFVGARINRRRRRFVGQFPDAIDLMVRGIRSGLPVAEALHAVGEELPQPIGGVFREVTGNVKLGMTLDEALGLAARRMKVQEFKFFMISLAIQQETGGNLAEILQSLGQLMRRREQVKLKIKAMSSEARASAMIIGSLPFIMMGIIGTVSPDYIMKLFIDPRGWLLLVAGLTSLGIGLAVMAKMVRFEI